MITVRSSGAWMWTSIALLAGASLALLIASLAVPERPGVVLALAGLTGLFVLRLIALHRGWSPRRRRGILT